MKMIKDNFDDAWVWFEKFNSILDDYKNKKITKTQAKILLKALQMPLL